ncbi:MAG: hypothetical protein AB7S70_05020 [Hyphomicrobium sp.]|uniref:hypothetical protein n=1 Tax=Hyphomicrobium sp. TaxID=82 RepID=UPI003D09B383
MTDKRTTEGTGLEAFEQVLDRYGSDRTRWPAPVRRDFAGLVANDPQAKARLSEAEALDRLLDLAPEPAIDTLRLADRILAAAAAEAPPVPAPQARVAWARLKPGSAAVAEWPAAALLAASLVLGAVFGVSGVFDHAAGPLVVEAASDSAVDPDVIAWEGDFEGDFGGDVL